MYREAGRPSIPPERLLKAGLLIAFYSVRSERLFREQLDYNLLFRWFLDMDIVEPSFDHSTFSRNRERLMEHEVAARFFGMVLEQAKGARLMSERALHRRRDALGSVGLDEEFSAQGRG
jgi:transposase